MNDRKTTNERLLHVEDQVDSLSKDVGVLKKQGEILIRLEEKVDQTTSLLSEVSNNGGFNRCVERGQIIGSISKRVTNLESGNTPEAVKQNLELDAVKQTLKHTNKKVDQLDSKITPLEKRVLMWVGGISAIMYTLPILLKYLNFLG